MASACLYLSFAKPNLIVNTDLLIFLWNYFSLICKAEILYSPQLYLKHIVLIQSPWQTPMSVCQDAKTHKPLQISPYIIPMHNPPSSSPSLDFATFKLFSLFLNKNVPFKTIFSEKVSVSKLKVYILLFSESLWGVMCSY